MGLCKDGNVHTLITLVAHGQGEGDDSLQNSLIFTVLNVAASIPNTGYMTSWCLGGCLWTVSSKGGLLERQSEEGGCVGGRE